MKKTLFFFWIVLSIASCNEYSPERIGIMFDCDFESGALGSYSYVPSPLSKNLYKYTIKPAYDPKNPYDKEYKEWARWFYFRMTGVKGKRVELNFKNIGSMSPYYSYDNKEFLRVSYDKADYKTISKVFEQDTVYLAYSKPYTFSRLKDNIKEWKVKDDLFSVRELGETSLGNPLYLCTITDRSIPDDLKKRVYIHSRIHPSETPSSEFIEDIINNLLENNSLLQSTIFYIIPMLNPDGVVEGMSRSNPQGVNLEVAYDYAPEVEQIENTIVKDLLTTLSSDKPLDLVLNLHSQVFNRYSFWLHSEEQIGELFPKQMQFQQICIANDDYFAKDNYYGSLQPHYVESFIYDNWGASTLALTLELPNDYYERLNSVKKIAWLTDKTIEYSAARLLISIQEYLQSPISCKN